MIPKNLIFRDFKNEDFEQVNQLWEETGMGGTARGDNLKIIQQTIQIGGKLIILEDTEKRKIVGTSWLTNDSRRIYLHHFGILPEYQGRGLAKYMLHESLEFAKAKGMQIKLEVHKDNTKACHLYKKYGFQYLGDYDVYIIRSFELEGLGFLVTRH